MALSWKPSGKSTLSTFSLLTGRTPAPLLCCAPMSQRPAAILELPQGCRRETREVVPVVYAKVRQIAGRRLSRRSPAAIDRRRVLRAVGLVVLSTLAAAAGAVAASDDTVGLAAYFPFDGSAGEASGVKIFGQLVTAGGIASDSNPEYVDGRFGNAIRFSGDAALRIPLDLHPDAYPQLTITAWVFLEDVGDEGDAILSTGEGDGAALRRSGRALEAKAGSDLLGAENALSPSRWNFIAGVWDYESGTARLHWRTRSVEGVIGGEELVPPEADIWLGAINDTLAEAADNLRIDELRIYARALEPEEISVVRDSAALKGRLTSTEGSSAARPPFVRAPRRPEDHPAKGRPLHRALRRSAARGRGQPGTRSGHSAGDGRRSQPSACRGKADSQGRAGRASADHRRRRQTKRADRSRAPTSFSKSISKTGQSTASSGVRSSTRLVRSR